MYCSILVQINQMSEGRMTYVRCQVCYHLTRRVLILMVKIAGIWRMASGNFYNIIIFFVYSDFLHDIFLFQILTLRPSF